jgi:hypothetical protein
MNVKKLLRAASFLVFALFLGELSGCNLCKDEVLDKASSPDGRWVATVLTRDCGATTSEYIAVNVHEVKQKSLDLKNDVFVIKHIHRLNVSWQGNDSLTIDCGGCETKGAEKKLERLGSVRVIYQ